MERIYRADYIRSAACSSVGDGNIVISYNGSFRKSNNVGGKFFVLYNIALPAMVVMMLIRGIVQVLGIELGKMGNGMLSGLAGLSHIGMMIAFFLLLFAIKRELIRKQ